MPSRYESFGHPLLEAIASGVPVIADRLHAIPEVVGDAALLINPDDVEELAETIHRVVRDPDVRSVLIQKGYERVKQFSWERTVNRTLEALETATRQP